MACTLASAFLFPLTQVNAPEDIFTSVARAASENNLPILVIGGHAVNAYGYLRTTVDADFMVCIDDLAAWRPLLERIGYKWIGQTQAFAKMQAPGDNPGLPTVDIMLVDASTLRKILAESRQLAFGETTLRVPKPPHLIGLKLHALKSPQRLAQGRDLPDILHLVRVCQVDTTSSEFKDILDRYGTAEIRTLLRKHLGDIS